VAELNKRYLPAAQTCALQEGKESATLRIEGVRRTSFIADAALAVLRKEKVGNGRNSMRRREESTDYCLLGKGRRKNREKKKGGECT